MIFLNDTTTPRKTDNNISDNESEKEYTEENSEALENNKNDYFNDNQQYTSSPIDVIGFENLSSVSQSGNSNCTNQISESTRSSGNVPVYTRNKTYRNMVEFQYKVIKAMRNITQRTQTPYLQHDVPRTYYQNLSQPTQFHLSHPSYVAPNINEDPRGIYCNYNVNESNKVHQYMTPNDKRSFSSTAEPSPESIDSLDTAESQAAVSDYDFDFSKSPVFYESLIN